MPEEQTESVAVPSTVKCVDCGYLSRKNHAQADSPYFEVTKAERATGNLPKETDRFRLASKPLCYQLALPSTEYDDVLGEQYAENLVKTAFLKVINMPRACFWYCIWKEGHTPEEHKIMYAQVELAKIKSQSDKDALDRTQQQFDKQLMHQKDEAEKSRNWQERQDEKRLADQKDRDADQHSKQVDRDTVLAGKQLRNIFVTAIVSSLVSVVAFFGGQCSIDKKAPENTIPTITQPTTTAPVQTK